MPQLAENTCALYGEQLGTVDYADSPAHVIPSALGGRYKPKGVLSSRANNELDRTVDNSFISIFGNAPEYFLGISRDRGGVDKVELIDDAGEAWRFAVDKDAVEPAKPRIDFVPRPDDGLEYEFSGTPEQAEKFLRKHGKSREEIAAIIKRATAVQRAAPRMSMGFRPVRAPVVHRFAWNAIALFAAAKAQVYSKEWRDGILSGSAPSRAGFVPKGGKFTCALGPFAHRIAIWAYEGGAVVYGYLQMFGGMGVGAVLTDAWAGGEMQHAYCVDPLTGEQAFPDFIPTSAFEQSFLRLDSDAAKNDVRAVFERIAREFTARGHGEAEVVVRS